MGKILEKFTSPDEPNAPDYRVQGNSLWRPVNLYLDFKRGRYEEKVNRVYVCIEGDRLI